MYFRYLDDDYGNSAFNSKQLPMKSIPISAMLSLRVYRTRKWYDKTRDSWAGYSHFR